MQVLELLRVAQGFTLVPGNPDCKKAMVRPFTTTVTDMTVNFKQDLNMDTENSLSQLTMMFILDHSTVESGRER